jgi:L-rhamnose mutarotase
MIYEMRTYTLKPGSIEEFEKRFAEALPYREKYSKLAAFWHTEIGPLNQVIHVWAYQDLNERMRVRAEARQDPHWPPQVRDLIQSQETKILIPAEFSPLK